MEKCKAGMLSVNFFLPWNTYFSERPGYRGIPNRQRRITSHWEFLFPASQNII